jgi:hypothetical protein
MSAAGRSEDDRTPDRVAAGLRDADFVRLVATADGDALAATGLLARALDAAEVPYQASLAAAPEAPATDADYTVAVGHADSYADVPLREEPIALAAADIAADLTSEAVDPTLALAGAVCAGAEPSGTYLERADLDRRPGVAVPTEDPVDGLAGSTLVHADFSGDQEAAEDAVSAVDAGRELASYVALSAVEDAPPRASEAVERALYPYETDRFETLGGYADVLDAVAREQPGTGLALALGHDVDETALEAWRAHGQRAHDAVREADTSRYNGVYAARVDPDAPLGTVARLLLTYRAPEPVALVATEGGAAVAGDGDIEGAVREAATSLDGRATARGTHGRATFDGTATDYIAAFREAL